MLKEVKDIPYTLETKCDAILRQKLPKYVKEWK